MARPDYDSFRELELDSWRAKAEGYDDGLATITRRANDPLLDALGTDFQNKRLVDVCTGTGHLVAAAHVRGAIAEGLDFADTMVERARRNYPELRFTQGDGENLPYADGELDFVTCMFGLMHFGDADRAISEAHRVLRPGGRYGFTVWQELGGEIFELINKAVAAHGTTDVPLPPAPPLFRFADPDQSRAALETVGFRDVTVEELPLTWQPGAPENVLGLIRKSLVRAQLLLEFQAPEIRERIEHSIIERLGDYRRGGVIRIAFPVVMVTATRA